MKLAFYILTVFFAVLAVRLTGDSSNDILPEIICVGFAILCFYCASIWDSLQDNNEVK